TVRNCYMLLANWPQANSRRRAAIWQQVMSAAAAPRIVQAAFGQKRAVLSGPGSVSLGGLMLLGHAGWDPAAVADGNAVVFGPGTDVAAGLGAGRGPARPAGYAAAGFAGMLGKRRELLTERAGVLAAQINLIVNAVEPEPEGFFRR